MSVLLSRIISRLYFCPGHCWASGCYEIMFMRRFLFLPVLLIIINNKKAFADNYEKCSTWWKPGLKPADWIPHQSQALLLLPILRRCGRIPCKMKNEPTHTNWLTLDTIFQHFIQYNNYNRIYEGLNSTQMLLPAHFCRLFYEIHSNKHYIKWLRWVFHPSNWSKRQNPLRKSKL